MIIVRENCVLCFETISSSSVIKHLPLWKLVEGWGRGSHYLFSQRFVVVPLGVTTHKYGTLLTFKINCYLGGCDYFLKLHPHDLIVFYGYLTCTVDYFKHSHNNFSYIVSPLLICFLAAPLVKEWR